MRIAACVYLAPRKLGSLEQWLVELCSETKRRGHTIRLFVHAPVHPAIEAHFRRIGVSWTPIQDLEAAPLRWSRTFRDSFDLIYFNLAAPRGRGTIAAYLAWPVPVLFFDATSGPAPGGEPRSPAGRLLDPLTLARVASLGGCSRYVIERDRRRFRLAEHRCRVIFNGVDPDRFHPPEQRAPGPPTIIAVGNLIREKGIDVLIDACRSVGDLAWKMIIVGDGPEESRLRTLAAGSGVGDRIVFTGLRHDVEALLREAEIYVHPARWEEAFGLTIAEAMATGCATVASKVGGIPEIIEDGASGLLVAAEDSGALSRCLRRLLEDGALRRRLGQAATTRIREHFTLRASVLGHLEWIELWGRDQRERAASALSTSAPIRKQTLSQS